MSMNAFFSGFFGSIGNSLTEQKRAEEARRLEDEAEQRRIAAERRMATLREKGQIAQEERAFARTLKLDDRREQQASRQRDEQLHESLLMAGFKPDEIPEARDERLGLLGSRGSGHEGASAGNSGGAG